MYRYKKVTSLCLGRPTAVSWSFGNEDYDERRVFVNKFDSVFTKLRNKWEISGISFNELSRTIEWCKAGCLIFTSFNECMHLTVKFDTVPINFIQGMRLNIDVVEKIRKVEQDRRTHLYGPTLKCLGSPHHPIFYPRLSDCDCCWLSNSSPPATRSSVHIHHPLLPLISSVLRKLDAKITVSSVKHSCCTIPPHYTVSWLSS